MRYEDSLYEIGFLMGQLKATLDTMTSEHHTCSKARFRYPWPPEPDCEACKKSVRRYAENRHLLMPYLLFGFDAIVDDMRRNMEQKERYRRAFLMKGAYI